MASATRLTLHAESNLSPQTQRALGELVELAAAQLKQRKLCLVQTREQLMHLDSQIEEFLADKSVPQRNAGLFLCRMAVHLRGIANELDGGKS